MTKFPVRVNPCSWYHKGQAYMYGGMLADTGVMQDSMWIMNMTSLPLTWVQFSNWTLGPSVKTWPKKNGRPHVGFRMQHGCTVLKTYPAMGFSTPVVAMFGGTTNDGPTNDLYLYDLTNTTWYWIKSSTSFPAPRAFHVSVAVATSCFVFGGQDSYGNILNDFWLATLTMDADDIDVAGIAWSVIAIASASKPVGRLHSAMAAQSGQLYMFGGLGVSQGATENILNDMWQYNPLTREWIPITAPSSTGQPPVARYGHSLSSDGKLIYMFAGVMANGQGDELWTYNPLAVYWTRKLPPFKGAMWPLRRAFHKGNAFDMTVTAEMVRVYQLYAAGMPAAAAARLNGWPETDFPTSTVPGQTNSQAFNAQVQLMIARVSKATLALVEGQTITCLLVYGGNSIDNGGIATGDMWIFDPVSELWQVPANFDARSDPDGSSGRTMHSMRANGQVLIVHGGKDEDHLKSASPVYQILVANGLPTWSYPYNAWPTATGRLIATASDAINGGSPPSPLLLPPTHMVSMPPVVFAYVSRVRRWALQFTCLNSPCVTQCFDSPAPDL